MTDRQRCAHITLALAFLGKARDILREAGAVRSVARVRSTIKSTEGALRHARLAPYRRERQQKRAPRWGSRQEAVW